MSNRVWVINHRGELVIMDKKYYEKPDVFKPKKKA